MTVKNDVWFLKGILFFREVAKWGSMTRAAQENGVKVTNLSRVISELEGALNLQLFDRRSTGMHLTAAGWMLMEKADELADQLDLLMAVRQKAQKAKTLVLQLPPGLTVDLSPFAEQYPLLNVVVREQGTFDVGLFWEKPHLWGFQMSCHAFGCTDSLRQSVWLAQREKEADAALLADFIVCRLRS